MMEQQFRFGPDGNAACGPLPGTNLASEAIFREMVNVAVELARAGNYQRARELCAAVILHFQPRIAAEKDLLRIMLHALLTARGFKMLSRLVMAVSGSEVSVRLNSGQVALGTPLRRTTLEGQTICSLDHDWLTRLSPDDAFLRQWSDILIPTSSRPAEAAGVPMAARRLELA